MRETIRPLVLGVPLEAVPSGPRMSALWDRVVSVGDDYDNAVTETLRSRWRKATR
jgi:hypothetical protein